MSFICIAKTELSTCQHVDLSTCRPMRWGLMVISVCICRSTVTYQKSLLAREMDPLLSTAVGRQVDRSISVMYINGGGGVGQPDLCYCQ